MTKEGTPKKSILKKTSIVSDAATPKAKEKKRVDFNSKVGVATFDRETASKLNGRINPRDDYERGEITREV